MKQKRHTTEEIIRIIREVDGGKDLEAVCRKHNVSAASFYRWKKKFGGMELKDARKYRQLEKENGHVESFHGSLRDECLDRELMLSVAEARVVIEDYRRHYNEERPHGGLGYRTPAQVFKEAQTGNTKVANTVSTA